MFSQMTMLKSRIREWLMDHPRVLTLAFLVVLQMSVYDLDVVVPQDGGAFNGP